MTSFPICIKTPKGIEEVERKTHGLPLKARQVLIMVDGRRDVAALETIFPPGTVVEVLADLLANGFVRELEPRPPASGAAPAASPVPSAPSLQPVKEAFSSALYDVFGPDADNFTKHIDSANSMDELGRLATKYEDVVLRMGGRKRSEAFIARLRAAGLSGVGAPAQSASPPRAASATVEPPAPPVPIEAPKTDRERLDMARQFMINTATTFSGVARSSLIVQFEQAREIKDLRSLYYDWREALQMSSSGRQRLPDLERRLAALLS